MTISRWISLGFVKTIQTVLLLVFAFSSLSLAQAGEADRKLDLKGIQFSSAPASGTRLFLSVTGQPPDILSLTNFAPLPLQRRQPTDSRMKVQVVLGKDIVGTAEVSALSTGFVPTAPRAPKLQHSSMVLTFDTAEQAARAAEAVGQSTTPKPLEKEKTLNNIVQSP